MGVLALAAAGVVGLLLPATAASARFVWNVTPSAPAGLYIIEPGGWRVGDRVAAFPSAPLAKDLSDRGVLPKGKLLIKRVVAAGGDTVCRQAGSLTLNGRFLASARQVDSRGRGLPGWSGCALLRASDIFLLGDTPESYDGRYFGVTGQEEIVGRVERVLPFERR